MTWEDLEGTWRPRVKRDSAAKPGSEGTAGGRKGRFSEMEVYSGVDSVLSK